MKSKEEIIKKFQKVRTDAISEMFDNPDECGIYPTTKFFKVLDNFLSKAIDQTREEVVGKLTEVIEDGIKNEWYIEEFYAKLDDILKSLKEKDE